MERRRVKFPIAAIFFLVLSVLNLIPPIYILRNLLTHGVYSPSQWYSFAQYLVPCLTAAFLAIVLLARKNTVPLIVALAVDGALLWLFRILYFALAFGVFTPLPNLLPHLLGAAAAIALVVIQMRATPRVKQVFSKLWFIPLILVAISCIFNLYSIFSAYSGFLWEYLTSYPIEYIFEDLFYPGTMLNTVLTNTFGGTLTIAGWVFLLLWISNPYAGVSPALQPAPRPQAAPQYRPAPQPQAAPQYRPAPQTQAAPQPRPAPQTQAAPAPASITPAAVEELKHCKELLDSGIISQAEFDAKKKQLLGL